MKLDIVTGSVRQGRASDKVAPWAYDTEIVAAMIRPVEGRRG